MSLRAFGSLLSSDAWSMDRFRSVPSGLDQLRDPLGASIRKVRRSPLCVAPALGVGETDGPVGPVDVDVPPVPPAVGLSAFLFDRNTTSPIPPPTRISTSTTTSTTTTARLPPPPEDAGG